MRSVFVFYVFHESSQKFVEVAKTKNCIWYGIGDRRNRRERRGEERREQWRVERGEERRGDERKEERRGEERREKKRGRGRGRKRGRGRGRQGDTKKARQLLIHPLTPDRPPPGGKYW